MVSKCIIGFIFLYIVLSIFALYFTGIINLSKVQSPSPLPSPSQVIRQSPNPYKGQELCGFTQVGYPPFGNFQRNGVMIDDNELIISDQLNFTLDKCRDECANNKLCGAFNFNMDKNECVQFGNKTTTSTSENIISYTKN